MGANCGHEIQPNVAKIQHVHHSVIGGASYTARNPCNLQSSQMRCMEKQNRTSERGATGNNTFDQYTPGVGTSCSGKATGINVGRDYGG